VKRVSPRRAEEKHFLTVAARDQRSHREERSQPGPHAKTKRSAVSVLPSDNVTEASSPARGWTGLAASWRYSPPSRGTLEHGGAGAARREIAAIRSKMAQRTPSLLICGSAAQPRGPSALRTRRPRRARGQRAFSYSSSVPTSHSTPIHGTAAGASAVRVPSTGRARGPPCACRSHAAIRRADHPRLAPELDRRYRAPGVEQRDAGARRRR